MQKMNLGRVKGDPGPKGNKGDSATITVSQTITGAPGSQASVSNVGTPDAADLVFTVPQGPAGGPGPAGDPGPQGPAATIAVGTVTTVNPGDPAAVTNSGTSGAAVFDFDIPKGQPGSQGIAATISVGTVTSVDNADPATVTNVGTANNAIFNFEIPKGEDAAMTPMPSGTMRGRITAGVGAPEDLNASDSRAVIGVSKNVAGGVPGIDANGSIQPIDITATNSQATLGSELVVNGSFTGDASGWTLGTGWAYGSNNVVYTGGNGNTEIKQTIPGVVSGRPYYVTWTETRSAANTNPSTARIDATNSTTTSFNAVTALNRAEIIIASSAGSLEFGIGVSDTGSGTVTIDDISVKEVSISIPVIIGRAAGRGERVHVRATDASNNTAVGYQSQQSLTTGNNNTAMGRDAQWSLTTGSSNTAHGYQSQQSLTTGNNNTAHGYQSQQSLTTGSSNTAHGFRSQQSLTTGNGDTAVGLQSQQSLTTGSSNTAVGLQSQQSLTTGNNNTAMGRDAQWSLTTGNNNTAHGYQSQQSLTTGINNTAVGRESQKSLTTGNDNTTVGYRSMMYVTMSSASVAIGHQAGMHDGSSNNVTDSASSIYIGANSKPLLGTLSANEIVIGGDAVGNGSNTATIGDPLSTSETNVHGHLLSRSTDNTCNLGDASYRWKEIFCANSTINTSDAREKTPVRPLQDRELDAAKQLAKELGAYQFLAAITEKGEDGARIHIGMTVQRAIEIMEENDLDPFAYSFICYDEWDERRIDYPELDELLDEDGNVIREAQEEHSVITLEAGNRYSFRYTELLLFVAAGFEARLTDLEERL